MRMCANHWAKLRAAIDNRGLSALVAETGEQAARNLISEVQDGRSIDNFDPLMNAYMAIITNCLSKLGPGIMLFAKPGDGDNCPLCAMNAASRDLWDRAQANGGKCPCGCGEPAPAEPQSYDGWIDFAADDQAEAWKAMKS